MAALANRMLAVLCVALAAASDGSCNCEVACADLVRDQRAEIARLQTRVRALRRRVLRLTLAPVRRAASAGSACSEESLELRSDEEIEALRGCRTLGHLRIHGASVTSLAGLQSLESASDVWIFGSGTAEQDQLTSLAGLESLRSVSGVLSISNNNNLVSLAGLDNLRSAGRFWITYNSQLESTTGLDNLATVEGDLHVAFNNKLKSLVGLGNLTSVGAGLHVEGGVDKLSSLSDYANVSSVRAGLVISDNPRLLSFAGLDSLRVAGRVNVTSGKMKSMAGLESLLSVGGGLHIEGNDKLLSLWGLQHLQSAGSINITGNEKLTTLTGLESVASVGTLALGSNHQLLSCSGLDGLRTAHHIRIDYHAVLESLDAFGNLTRLEELSINSVHYVHSLSGLKSLQSVSRLHMYGIGSITSLAGLDSLTSVEDLFIGSNFQLTSLLGLEGLQTAARVELTQNERLLSLRGLGNLRTVRGDFIVQRNFRLLSLEGLESLHSVGIFYLGDWQRQLSSFYPGLQNLAYAYRGFIMDANCVLSSLHGLGSLHLAGELRVSGPGNCRDGHSPMKFLGGPIAAGASIVRVHIAESAWPRCMTAHERAALLSNTLSESSIPEQRCETRELVGPFKCTKGHPCKFSIANFTAVDVVQGGPQSVFISGLTTGCGTCPENHMQSVVKDGGLVDFGYALRNAEAGLRSICLCVGSEPQGPVGELILRGSNLRGSKITCTRGHDCRLKLDGEGLERVDRVVVTRSNCSEVDPASGFAASWSAENEYVLRDLATWYSAQPVSYQVCWRPPCSLVSDEPVCPAPEDTYVHVGEVEVFGPYPTNYTVARGGYLSVANVGLGVLDGDRMRLMRTCGQANGGGLEVVEAISEAGWFHFGALTAARVPAGRHHLCWCQDREGDNAVECKDEHDFMADSGEVRILCLGGQELDVDSGLCKACPAGRQKLDEGLELCSECFAGQFSPGGTSVCAPCQEGTFAEAMGSSACASCWGWQSSNAEATDCTANPPMLLLLASFHFSVGAMCWLFVRTIGKQLSIVDVSLDQGRTLVTTFGPHGLSSFGRPIFPVTFCATGHPGLNKPSSRLYVRVKDTARLELLTKEGPITSRLDTCMGKLVVPFPHDLYHRGWPLPAFVCLPGLLLIAVTLGVLVATADMATEGFLGAAASAMVCTAASAALRSCQHATPLRQRLLEFKNRLTERGRTTSCNKGPDRAITVGQLHELLEFFSEYIRDRTAYFLTADVLVPLTTPDRLSYAELVGPGQVEWFVSHFWGTAYTHFCMALRKHAETVCDNRDWSQVRYWVCFCSNNQHRIEEELGSGWEESSFYVTLKSGRCQGTCMVLDDEALPLTRIWCIFELLQTVKLQSSSEDFQGLLLCTSGGVLNKGSGSVEVATALAKKVAGMNLETAQATKKSDAMMIRAEVVKEMGSFGALNRFVCEEVHAMLACAQSNANQQFAAVLAHLEESMQVFAEV